MSTAQISPPARPSCVSACLGGSRPGVRTFALRQLQLGVAVALALTSLACAAPFAVKRVTPPQLGDTPTATPPIATEPSEGTLQTLRLLDLERTLLEEEPLALVLALEKQRTSLKAGIPASQDEILASQAELALLAARRAESLQQEMAAGLYLLAARCAHDYLRHEGPTELSQRAFDPRLQQTSEVYNRSLGRYLTLLPRIRGTVGPHVQNTALGNVLVRVAEGPELLDPSEFDALLVADELQVHGLRNHYRRPGLGAALVVLGGSALPPAIRRSYQPEGVIGPATAVMTFERLPEGAASVDRIANLAFYDPDVTTTVRIDGHRIPLAADYTTPLAYLLEESNLRRLSRPGILHPERTLEDLGLFLIGPYDPRQIPVIMVHGLRSSPLAWMELTNDLSGDPELRRAYQFWHYKYPTGLPWAYSGALLRKALRDLRQTLDPEGDDPAMQSIVIIAHSMGGLLARTLISDSGMKIWQAAFRVPPEELASPPDIVEQLRQALIFRPEPYIDRVIFIATPHRGSDFAGSVLGRVSSGLISLPAEFQTLVRRIGQQNGELMVPSMRKIMRRGGPTSVRALRPDYPLMEALTEIPIDPGVRFHSIIGDRRHSETAPVTDGYVDYESAHLEGAQSEKIVPAGHSTQAHPLAIAEVRRILRQHLDDR